MELQLGFLKNEPTFFRPGDLYCIYVHVMGTDRFVEV